MKVQVIRESADPQERWTLPKAPGTVFKSGQLVSLESNAAVHMDAVTEDATFAGVVAMGAPDGTTEVLVLKKCEVLIDLDSAQTLGAGAGLKYNAGGSSTDYSLTPDGGANTIAFCAKEYTTTVDRARATIDVMELQKIDAVAA